MRIDLYKILIAFFPVILFIFGGCRNDDVPASPDMPHDLMPLSIRMMIEGSKNAPTRAIRTKIDDRWSFTDFTFGDEMGFYASGGNWIGGGVNKPFVNYKLVYVGNNTFKSDDNSGSVFSPSGMKGNEVYMYFPYSANMGAQGLELRVHPDTDGSDPNSWRCIDFLSSSTITINEDKGALYGDFQHGFAELIIMRGEGFDHPTNSDITVVLSEPCTNLRIEYNSTGGWNLMPELVYDPNNTARLTEEKAKEWMAWKGGNYHITDNDEVGVDAWYVILPTIGKGGQRTTVSYIQLYDNEGNLQNVTAVPLSGWDPDPKKSNPTKFLDADTRFPLTISMKELVPTVNPCPIEPWGESIDLTDSRTRGINDLTEFEEWVRDYNTYLSDPDNEVKREVLLKYGDKIIDGDTQTISWHFYVLSDIDLSNYQPLPWTDKTNNQIASSDGVILPQLNDILDGESTVLQNGKFMNHKIRGLNKTFISEMKGTLQNFDFIDPNVMNPVESENSAGILSLKMINASISHCNIKDGNLFNPGGPGGMVTGTMSGGIIRDCTLDGSLFGASTATDPPSAQKIVGENPDINAQFENNNATRVVFQLP